MAGIHILLVVSQIPSLIWHFVRAEINLESKEDTDDSAVGKAEDPEFPILCNIQN
ncbi:hypothetical protein OsI_34578 [Oryza sativa Indica Group]|uniref:Uncharacterized protein n=1 Tax=Oryza sativa subsp. indica TaxID=39946 RepID=A2ZA14_ORYSI|nr:hypothetical protein OsI_34578 [Oryza sativa Indica Group]